MSQPTLADMIANATLPPCNTGTKYRLELACIDGVLSLTFVDSQESSQNKKPPCQCGEMMQIPAGAFDWSKLPQLLAVVEKLLPLIIQLVQQNQSGPVKPAPAP